MIIKRKMFMLATLLSVVLLVSVGLVSAESSSHNFKIGDRLIGFSARNAEISYETVIVKEGGAEGSIRVKIAEGKTYANLAVKDNSLDGSHPDWIANWTPYNRIAAWIYFDELDSMPDNKGVAIRVGGNKSTQVLIAKPELTVGWNYIEADLLTLVAGQADLLTNMGSLSIELVVDKTGMYIVDEIRLVKATD